MEIQKISYKFKEFTTLNFILIFIIFIFSFHRFPILNIFDLNSFVRNIVQVHYRRNNFKTVKIIIHMNSWKITNLEYDKIRNNFRAFYSQ